MALLTLSRILTNAPISKGLRILLLLFQASLILGTGPSSRARIHAGTKTHAVKMIEDIRHPICERRSIGLERAVRRLAVRVAVVKDDVVTCSQSYYSSAASDFGL